MCMKCKGIVERMGKGCLCSRIFLVFISIENPFLMVCWTENVDDDNVGILYLFFFR